MIRRYDLGLNTRNPFIKAEDYLIAHFPHEKELKGEKIEPMIDVPVREYSSSSNLKVRLIGDLLVDRRYLEIEGESKDIAQLIKDLKANDVRMKLMK